jgi:hypothetical protein
MMQVRHDSRDAIQAFDDEEVKLPGARVPKQFVERGATV